MDNKVSINTLAAAIAQTTGKTKKFCEDFVKEFFKVVSENITTEDSLKIKGFGTFKVIEVESRSSVNIHTGERQEISPYKKVVFTPSKEMAAKLNAPFEEFESVEIEDDMPEELFYNEEALVDMGEENNVSEENLEVGSKEEDEDDKITLEAYTEVEHEKTIVPPVISNHDDHSQVSENIAPASVQVDGNLKETTFPNDYPISEKLEENREIIQERVNESTEPTVSESSVKTETLSTSVIEPSPEVNSSYYYQPPVFEQEEPDHFRNVESKKSRFGVGFLVGTLSTLVICVIIFMLGCFFDWWPNNFQNFKVAEAELISDSQEDEPFEEENRIQTEPEKEPVYDTVSTTRYLTTIAREHYGDFNFWPYIYLENASILGHPDRITPGTKVIVPELSKYGVDPANKADVATAKKKALEIYARFK